MHFHDADQCGDLKDLSTSRDGKYTHVPTYPIPNDPAPNGHHPACCNADHFAVTKVATSCLDGKCTFARMTWGIKFSELSGLDPTVEYFGMLVNRSNPNSFVVTSRVAIKPRSEAVEGVAGQAENLTVHQPPVVGSGAGPAIKLEVRAPAARIQDPYVLRLGASSDSEGELDLSHSGSPRDSIHSFEPPSSSRRSRTSVQSSVQTGTPAWTRVPFWETASRPDGSQNLVLGGPMQGRSSSQVQPAASQQERSRNCCKGCQGLGPALQRTPLPYIASSPQSALWPPGLSSVIQQLSTHKTLQPCRSARLTLLCATETSPPVCIPNSHKSRNITDHEYRVGSRECAPYINAW